VPGCGFAPGEKVEGFKRKQMVQAQMTGTYVQGATLGANRLTIIGEVGGQWFPDLERKEQLRYEAPDFADWTAWGYRLAAGLEYLSAIGPINLEPVVAFEHDVSGTSPSPVSNFVEDVKAVTLSLTASYLSRWEAQISYTNFFGAGNRNSLNDRDHISMVVSYAF